MLKILTAYSTLVMIISYMVLMAKVLLSDESSERAMSVLSMIFNAPIFYVIIKMLLML